MNILHHKSWHVRTKENIARVRRDEAKAAAENAEKQRRADEAESEARINFLRKRSVPTSTVISEQTSSLQDADAPSGTGENQHVDLFSDYENKMKKIKPMDEEKRLEQEKYEKQIGYLTYLGQDTNEALGTRNWYDVAPKRQDEFDEKNKRIEIGLKAKHLYDPMIRFLKQSIFEPKAGIAQEMSEENKLKSTDKMQLDLGKTEDEVIHKKKHKKEKKKHKHKHKKRKHKSKKSGSDSDDEEELQRIKMEKLRLLREQRIQRENVEKNRTKEFLIQKFPELAPPPPPPSAEDKKRTDKERAVPFVKQKYNSQFNPFLAKQNYS